MPDYKKIILPTPDPEPEAPSNEPSTLATIGAMASRVGGGMLGALGGGALGTLVGGPAGTIPGAVLGGGAGGAGGESLAEWLEGSKQSGKRIALEGALSAVPGGMIVKEGRPGISALMGLANAGVGTAGRKIVAGEDVSKAINPTEWGLADQATLLGGAGLSAGLAKIAGPASKVKIKPPTELGDPEVLDMVKKARTGAPNPTNSSGPAIPMKLSNAEHEAVRARVDKYPEGPVAKAIGIDPKMAKKTSITDVNDAHMEAKDLKASEWQAEGRRMKKEEDLRRQTEAASTAEAEKASMVAGPKTATETVNTKTPAGTTLRVSNKLMTPEAAATAKAVEEAKNLTANEKATAATKRAEEFEKAKEGLDQTTPSVSETVQSEDATGRKGTVKTRWVPPPPPEEEDIAGAVVPQLPRFGSTFTDKAAAEAHAAQGGGVVKPTTKGYQVVPPEMVKPPKPPKGAVPVSSKPVRKSATTKGPMIDAEEIGLNTATNDPTKPVIKPPTEPPTEPPPIAPVPNPPKGDGPKPKGGKKVTFGKAWLDEMAQMDKTSAPATEPVVKPKGAKAPKAAVPLTPEEEGIVWTPKSPEENSARLTPEVNTEIDSMIEELKQPNDGRLISQLKSHRDIQDATPHAPAKNGKLAKMASEINQEAALKNAEQVKANQVIGSRHHEGVVAAAEARLAKRAVNAVEEQPVLPGAEDVRGVENPTPAEPEPGFNLSGEVSTEPKAQTGDLLSGAETNEEKLVRMKKDLADPAQKQYHKTITQQVRYLEQQMAKGKPPMATEATLPVAEASAKGKTSALPKPSGRPSPEEWEAGLNAREAELVGRPNPTMVDNPDASDLLKGVGTRATKLADLYKEYQGAYKAGVKPELEARTAGSMASSAKNAAEELANEETLALNPDALKASAEGRFNEQDLGNGAKRVTAAAEGAAPEAKYNPFLTKTQVAEKLGVSERTVERLVKTNKLGAIPMKVEDDAKSNLLRFKPEDVEEYLKSGKPNSNEAGFIDPKLSMLMAKGANTAVGAGIGAAGSDEDHRMRGALIGGAVGLGGTSAIEYFLKHPTHAPTVPSKVSDAANMMSEVTRFNLLSQWPNILYNAHIAPWSAGIMGAIEHGLTENPEEGLKALKAGYNPLKFARDMKDNYAEAVEMIGRNERGEMVTGEAPTPFRKLLSAPGTVMTAGDVTARKNMTGASIPEEVARRATVTFEPWSKTGKRLADFGRGNPAGAMLLPFARTSANVMESGLERTPFAGFLVHMARSKALGENTTFEKQLIQQGLGGSVAYGAYLLGQQISPETAHAWKVDRMIGNMGGQYSMLAAAGFAAGQASQKGKNPLKAGVQSIFTDMPLPTTQIPMDYANTAMNWMGGKPAHPKSAGLERYLPNTMVPGVFRKTAQTTVEEEQESLKNFYNKYFGKSNNEPASGGFTFEGR